MITFLRCSKRKEKKIVLIIFRDNEASIQLARGLSNTEKIKHVDTTFYYILNEIREGNLKIFVKLASLTSFIVLLALGSTTNLVRYHFH